MPPPAPQREKLVYISGRLTDCGPTNLGGDGSIGVIQAALERRGYACFSQESALAQGGNTQASTESAATACSCMLVLCTADLGKTKRNIAELEKAQADGKVIIPIWHSADYPPEGMGQLFKEPKLPASKPLVSSSVPEVVEELIIRLQSRGIYPAGPSATTSSTLDMDDLLSSEIKSKLSAAQILRPSLTTGSNAGSLLSRSTTGPLLHSASPSRASSTVSEAPAVLSPDAQDGSAAISDPSNAVPYMVHGGVMLHGGMMLHGAAASAPSAPLPPAIKTLAGRSFVTNRRVKDLTPDGLVSRSNSSTLGGASAPSTSLATSPRAPSMSLPGNALCTAPTLGPSQWHLFLSHYQSNAGNTIMTLKLFLERACTGLRCWVDQDQDPTEAGMRQGISNSSHYLLYLTKDALTRPAVQFEARTALSLNKPVILVRETDPRWGAASSFDDYIRDAPDDLKVLFSLSTAIPWFRDKEFRDVSLRKILRAAGMTVDEP